MTQVHPLSHNQELLLAFAAEAGFAAGDWADQIVIDVAACDARAVRAAVDALVARHPALRSRIAPVAGRRAQVVGEAGAPTPLRVDPAGHADVARTVRAERGGFDLAAGPPVRAVLLPRPDGTGTVVLTISHLVTDHGSDEVLAREFAELYDGRPPGGPPPAPYSDFARWQRAEVARYLRDTRSSPLWRAYDADAAALAPGGAGPVRTGAAARRGTVHLTVPPAHVARLGAAARSHGHTLAALLLASLGVALRRTPGLGVELLVGDRAIRYPDRFEQTVGLFADIWPICRPAALPADPVPALDVTGARAIAALDGTLPFIILVARHPWLATQLRSAAGPPWMFVQFVADPPARPAGSRVTAVSFPDPPGREHAAFRLHLKLVLHDGELRGTLDHGGGLEADARALLAAMVEAMGQLAGAPVDADVAPDAPSAFDCLDRAVGR